MGRCRVPFSNAPHIGIKDFSSFFRRMNIFNIEKVLFHDELKVRWKTAPYDDPIFFINLAWF